ncbi:MAG: hypothetical protein ACRDZU_04800 [Acidimicrobiales bacterium]
MTIALLLALTPQAGSEGIPLEPLVSLDQLGVDLALTSDNLTYLGTIPLDSPGVGARVVKVGRQRRLYVTGVPGVSIYDVTTAEAPTLLGHLALPNWENEDISVSADGDWAIVTEYTGTLYVHIIDTRNPRVPLLASTLVLETAGHTSECLDPACDWVYGSEGQILDLRDKLNPIVRPETWMALLGLPDGHAINIDRAGLATIDTTPLTLADVSDPLHPKVLAQAPEGEQADNGTAYQHNTLRPGAHRWRPRTTVADRRDPGLRPGELILGNGETNLTGTCNEGSGPFATWSARDWDRAAPLQVLDVFRPVNGEYANGDPIVNVAGCSGHWFTTRTVGADQLVAAGWYEHGTRLLRVNGRTGAISQVGYFQPIVGSASAAHWVDDTHIYVVDYARGIDVLRYDPNAPAPSQAELDASWAAKVGVVDPVAELDRQICRLFATN